MWRLLLRGGRCGGWNCGGVNDYCGGYLGTRGGQNGGRGGVVVGYKR